MSQRPAGFDRREVDQALQAFGQAGSFDDLERLIHELPLFSEPFYHAILRQEYMRLNNSSSPYLENFAGRYFDLFTLLHDRSHRGLFNQHPSTSPGPYSPAPFYAPPFISGLAEALNGRLPTPAGRPLHPVRDQEKILQEAAQAAGLARLTLPVYQPQPGSHWSAVIAVCAGCRQKWLALRAYAVDLVRAPDLLAPLQAGLINTAGCPYCGERLCGPAAVWFQDDPGAGDSLACLSCAWRLTESAYSYQPPPGTQRDEKNDRILEIRFSQLLSELGWTDPQSPEYREQPEVLNMTVSYSQAELLAYLERTAAPEAFTKDILVGELRRKVQSGLLPLYQVEASIMKTLPQVAKDWPIVHPGIPASRDDDDLIVYLIEVLVAEAAAEAQEKPPGIKALLASSTSQAYLMLGKTSLAEAALARAEDFFAQADPTDPAYTAFAAGIGNARAELADVLRDYDTAAAQRRQVILFAAGADTLAARLAALQIASSQTLTEYEGGRLGLAMASFSDQIGDLYALLEEASGAADPEDQALQPAIQHSLSGSLANWAAVVTDLAEHLETYLQFAELPEIMQRMIEQGTGQLAAKMLLEEAWPALEVFFPEGINPESMFNTAREALSQALELAESLQSWEYAGIQAHRLGGLLDRAGDYEAAEAMLSRAITYAARAGDHTRVWTAHAYLAQRAMDKNDGQQALEHLQQAGREWIREKVSQGFHADLGSDVSSLGSAALETVGFGADALQAVALVESLKAATTAASLARGMPVQPDGKEADSPARTLQALVQEREDLRLQALGNPKDETLAAELARIQAAVLAERQRLSLRDPRFGEWVDATDIDLTSSKALLAMLAHFGPKTTLLGTLTAGPEIWTYLAWQGGCLVKKSTLPDEPDPPTASLDIPVPVQDKIDRHFIHPEAEYDLEQGRPWEPAYLIRLAEAVLAPLEERLDELGPQDRLIISAANELGQVPFAALPYRGELLCQRVQLSLVQSLSVLDACLYRPMVEYETALCLGAPARPDLSDLPGALAEVTEIAALFAEQGKVSRLVTRAEATVPALKSGLNGADVVHLACHAHAGDSAQSLSSLMLAPSPAGKDSGNLTEDRILFEILLKPGCLVNLAGCSTGLQVESGAPLLGGLIPAFLVAGASSVLGSLWPIHDLNVARFQAEFYRHLLEGDSPSASLAKTQRDCLAGRFGESLGAAPVWASFVIYGVG